MNSQLNTASSYLPGPSSEQRSVSDDNRDGHLEDLKLRESARISTAEDVKALLEAEFRGIAEIQQSQQLSEEEFKLIENLYWHKMKQGSCHGVDAQRGDIDAYRSSQQPQQQYRTFPGAYHNQPDEPNQQNSLRHEQKLKRHVLEEVVLEDSDKFYERTLNKKVKKYDPNYSYHNQETLPKQNTTNNVGNVVYRNAKKQPEYLMADRASCSGEGSRTYIVNKENLSSLPRDFNHVIYANQDRPNELLVEDINVYKDKRSSGTPLRLRHNFEHEIEASRLEKEKNRKSRLEGTESKIRPNPKINQDEIVLDDKLLFEETQQLTSMKAQKKPSYHTKIMAPKFKSRFRKSKRSKKSKYDYAEDVQNVPILHSTRKNQEEIVLENLDTFSETTLTKKKKKKDSKEPTSSLERSQCELMTVEQDLYNQSIRCQSINHKGPQKEIYLQGEEIISETTLKKPKKIKIKKSPKFSAEVTDLSSQILETERKKTEEGDGVVLTSVVHKEPQYTYKVEEVETHGIAAGGCVIQEKTDKSGKKSKNQKTSGGKLKPKRYFFKKKKASNEIVVEDSKIFEDHNRAKKIHVTHGDMDNVLPVNTAQLLQLEEEEQKYEIQEKEIKDKEMKDKETKEKERKEREAREKEAQEEIKEAKKEAKEKKKDKSKKNKTQGESIVDKSFVYEDAGRIGLPTTSASVAHTTTVEETVTEPPIAQGACQRSDAVEGGCKADTNINILNIQEEKIVNENYFVADDTKFKLSTKGTKEESTQDNMGDKQKDNGDGKHQKFKVKLPDINFRRKSKQTDSVEATKAQDSDKKSKVESEAVVEGTSVEVPQSSSEQSAQEKDPQESVDAKDSKHKFKFHMPDIHLPTFNKSTPQESSHVVNGDTVVTESKSEKKEKESRPKFKMNVTKASVKDKSSEEYPHVEASVDESKSEEKKEDPKHKFKFHMPDFHMPSFKSKAVEEKTDSGQQPANVDQKQNKENPTDVTATATTENKELVVQGNNPVTIQLDGQAKDQQVKNEVILPNIQIKKNPTEENKETTKADEPVKEVLVQESHDNMETSVTENEVEGKNVGKSGDKKFKFNFPHINISKPNFGKKNKDKDVAETDNTAHNTAPAVQEAVASKEVTDNKVTVEKPAGSDGNVTVTLPEVKANKPHLPPPPVFKSADPKQTNIALESTQVTSPAKDVNETVHKMPLKDAVTTVIKPKTRDEKELVVVKSGTIIQEETEDESGKKHKFNLPHFNIPKPNFHLKKSKEPKSEVENEKSNVEISSEPIKEIPSQATEDFKAVEVVTNGPQKATTATINEVSLGSHEVSLPSTSLTPVEQQKLDDDVFVNETNDPASIKQVTLPEVINSPSVSKPDFEINVAKNTGDVKTTKDAVEDKKIEIDVKTNELKTNAEIDEKAKLSGKKFKLNFPQFGKKKDKNTTEESDKAIAGEATIKTEARVEDSTKISPLKPAEGAINTERKVESTVIPKPASIEMPKEAVHVETKIVNPNSPVNVTVNTNATDHVTGTNNASVTAPTTNTTKTTNTTNTPEQTKMPANTSSNNAPSGSSTTDSKETGTEKTTPAQQEEKKAESSDRQTEKKSGSDKPTFMGKLRSNLPQICVQKSGSPETGACCMRKKNQEKVEVASKTVVVEDVADKKKKEKVADKTPSAENTLEKKKKRGFLEKFQTKKNQKELDAEDSTLEKKKKKDKVYIMENDLSEESPKGLFGRTKKNKKALEESAKKEKQGELVVVGDTLVTESMKLSREELSGGGNEGRLSAFLQDGQTSPGTENKIVLDANNKPVFGNSNAIEREKFIENVQREADADKKKLFVDENGAEISVGDSLHEGLQTTTSLKTTGAAVGPGKEQQGGTLTNQKWSQSPNKKNAFFSTIADDGRQDDKKPLEFVVVAIDFGTTFSGYAFSFNRDIESIHVMRKWEGGDPGVTNQKTPTTLLLDPTGKFHSFGFTARDFYHDLSPKEAQKWMYFEKFKMALHYNAVSCFVACFVLVFFHAITKP